WCAPTFGGLDVMKWHSDAPTRRYTSTQMPCEDGDARILTHEETAPAPLSDDWHIWSVAFGPEGVRFELDGQVLHSQGGDADTSRDTAADFASLDAATFAAVMDQLWQLRITTEVRKPGDAFAPPNPT